MERRFNRQYSSRENGISKIVQPKDTNNDFMPKKGKDCTTQQQVPDLTDFMNDLFFGTVKSADQKPYDFKGDVPASVKQDDHDQENINNNEDFEHSNRSSKLTHEWLEEAKRIVASSPVRCESPSRLVGSPRFAAAQGRSSLSSVLDRRDPLSRSARRYRTVESFSGEILTKSHNRHNSEQFETHSATSPRDSQSASAIHNWFSNILKPPSPRTPPHQPINNIVQPPSTPIPIPIPLPLPLPLPPRLSLPQKTRFHKDPSSARPQGIPIPFRRTSQTPSTPLADTHVLSPPKNLIQSAHRRSISSATCSLDKTCSKLYSNGILIEDNGIQDLSLNGFLKDQRIRLGKILDGDVDDTKAKIVLSGPSNSTSSMVAAICYAWLMENRLRKENNSKGGERAEYLVLPAMSVPREKMWKQQQAAWLFNHVGLDTTSLLFADEVDLESLMMAGKLRMLVVGQDIIRINGEVGSRCTILTDNYCEDAYELLQTPMLKKLLLAAILLDTQNLKSASAQLSMTRDSEAVQLLLVGSNPNYRNALFDELTQVQRDKSFFEALQHSYGKPPNESVHDQEHQMKSTSVSLLEAKEQNSDKKSRDSTSAKSNKVSPKSAKPRSSSVLAPSAPPAQAAPEKKNKFFLAKWFGFGSK